MITDVNCNGFLHHVISHEGVFRIGSLLGALTAAPGGLGRHKPLLEHLPISVLLPGARTTRGTGDMGNVRLPNLWESRW